MVRLVCDVAFFLIASCILVHKTNKLSRVEPTSPYPKYSPLEPLATCRGGRRDANIPRTESISTCWKESTLSSMFRDAWYPVVHPGASGSIQAHLSGAINYCSFHPCVQYDKFELDNVVSFVPPDGVLTLMTYRLKVGQGCSISSPLNPNRWAVSSVSRRAQDWRWWKKSRSPSPFPKSSVEPI